MKQGATVLLNDDKLGLERDSWSATWSTIKCLSIWSSNLHKHFVEDWKHETSKLQVVQVWNGLVPVEEDVTWRNTTVEVVAIEEMLQSGRSKISTYAGD